MSKTRLIAGLVGVLLILQPQSISAQSKGETEKQRPKVVSQVMPAYPAEAIGAGVEGRVILEATIERNSEVSDVKVLAGHRLLSQAAIDAAKQWRFNNTFDRAVTIQLSFNFKYFPRR